MMAEALANTGESSKRGDLDARHVSGISAFRLKKACTKVQVYAINPFHSLGTLDRTVLSDIGLLSPYLSRKRLWYYPVVLCIAAYCNDASSLQPACTPTTNPMRKYKTRPMLDNTKKNNNRT
jgi:hypothetical protein